MRERKNDDDDDDYNKTHHVYDDPLKLVEELRRDRQLTRTRPDSKKVQNVDTTTKDAKKRPKSKFGFKLKAKSKNSRSKQYELSPNEIPTVSDEPSTSGVQDNKELTSSYANDGFKAESEDCENDLTVNVLLSKESKKAGTPANITVKNVDLEQSSISGATTGSESVSSTLSTSSTAKGLREQTSKVKSASTRPTPKKRSNISSMTAASDTPTEPVPSSTSSPTHSKELKETTKAKPSSTRPKPKKRSKITKTSTLPTHSKNVDIDKPEPQSQSDVTRTHVSETFLSPDTQTSTSLRPQNISKTGLTASPPSAATTTSDQTQILPIAPTRQGTKTSKTKTSTSTASKTKISPTHAKQKRATKAPIVPVIKLEGPSEDSKESPTRMQPTESVQSDKSCIKPNDVTVVVHDKTDQSSVDHLKPSTSGVKTKKPTPTSSSLLSPNHKTPSSSPLRTKKESPYAEITPRQDPNKTSGPVSPPEPQPRTSSEVRRTSPPSIIVTSSDGVSSDVETGVETNLERDHPVVTSSSSISSKTIEILFRRQKRKRVFLLLVTLFLFFLLVGVVGVGIFLSSLARDTEEVSETINEPVGNT